MIGHEIDARNGDELVRFVRALGQHRYAASRLHLVHAFAIEAACVTLERADGREAPGEGHALVEAQRWAAAVLNDPDIDRASRDERLHRRASDAELVAVLCAFWTARDARHRASKTLEGRLAEIGAPRSDPERLPFDESAEDDIFPLLLDAGWELLPLRALDRERHRGAIAAIGDDLAFDIAKFEEENTLAETITLHELPALGPLELLAALDDDGAVRAPFVLWASGNDAYVDYVLRGVLRAAKLER